jgi:hypothetical protein
MRELLREKRAQRVSFDIRWGDVIQHLHLHDTDNQFEGSFLQTHASIDMFGRERNGIFFQ